MQDSFYYVLSIIYDADGNYKKPTKMDNLYQHIQNLVLLYKENPDWPNEVLEDMKRFVDDCVNLLEKM